jgi:hypothetical protein
MQRFKKMVGYSLYEISNDGIIRRIVTKEKISQRIHPGYGYKMCDLQDNDLKVHTVYPHKEVARAYIPTKKKGKLYVIHVNGKQQDNRVNNLQWATPAEAQIHQLKMGFRKRLGNPELYKYSRYWKAKQAKKGKGKESVSKSNKGKLIAKAKGTKAAKISTVKNVIAKRNALQVNKNLNKKTNKAKAKGKKQESRLELKGKKNNAVKKAVLKKKVPTRSKKIVKGKISKLENKNARSLAAKKPLQNKKAKAIAVPAKKKVIKLTSKKNKTNKNLILKKATPALVSGIKKPAGKVEPRRGKRQRIKYRKVITTKPK